MADYFTPEGAARIAAAIESHWLRRGYVVKTSIVDGGFVQLLRVKRYDVRSDMVNGFPVRRVPDGVRR